MAKIKAVISDFNGTIIPGYLELGLIAKWYVVTHFYDEYKTKKKLDLLPLIELTEHLRTALIKYQDYLDGKDYDAVARHIEYVVEGMDADYVEEYFRTNRSQRGKIQRYLYFLSMFKPALKKFLYLFDASPDKTIFRLLRKAKKKGLTTAVYSSALEFPIEHYLVDNKVFVDKVYGNQWERKEEEDKSIISFKDERVNRADKYVSFPALLHELGFSSGEGVMYIGDNEPELSILKYVEYPVISRFAKPRFVDRVKKEVPHALFVAKDKKTIFKLLG